MDMNIHDGLDKHFEIPKNLTELIAKKFRGAVSRGGVIYVESDVKYHEGKAFTYQIRIVPAFVRKPSSIQDQDEKPQPKRNGLIDIRPGHLIAEAGPFRIILNAYCAVENQILLTSASLRSQYETLGAYELASIHRVLKALPRNYIAFYNCGKESGASQAHKHVQVLALEPSEFQKLFPNEVKQKLDGSGQPILIQQPGIPYTHFIIRPVGAECTGAYLLSLFNTLLSATKCTLASYLGAPPAAPQYNFLMTPNWLMMIPRTSAMCNGVGVNALGMLGVVWVTSNDQLQIWSTTGFDEILARVGVPKAEEDIEAAMDI